MENVMFAHSLWKQKETSNSRYKIIITLQRGAKKKFKNITLPLYEKLLSQNWLIAVAFHRQETTIHLNCFMLLS